jgi:outer membrane protein TolC
MELPLFDGGYISASIREQLAVLAAAQERLGNLELQIRLEVESALSNLQSTEERMESTRTSIAQARESLRIEQQKYELGSGTIVDVLDAQAALLETETTYYRIQSEYHIAAAQFQLAIGVQ